MLQYNISYRSSRIKTAGDDPAVSVYQFLSLDVHEVERILVYHLA